MTRYMNFMRHKPWEPTNFQNQERLFKAEQKVEHEKKQSLLLIKEREKERELERIRELNRKNNFIVVRETEENEDDGEEVPCIPQAVAASTLEEYLAKKKELEAAVLAAQQAEEGGPLALKSEAFESEDTESIGWGACESDVYSESSSSGSDSSSDSEASSKKKRKRKEKSKKKKKHKRTGSEQEAGKEPTQLDAIAQARKEQQDKLKEYFQLKYAAILKEGKSKDKKHKKKDKEQE